MNIKLHASLFSGIGGFDLAAKWAGLKTAFQVEKDDFCTKVLRKNFPEAKQYEDIKQFNGTEYRGRIYVLSGGFPCQPFSIAGSRNGSKDDRYLWPEMLRVISEINPKWVIAENVPGVINIEDGLVFENICTDLETQNYSVWPFIIPASAVKAPHKRDRLWIVANSADSETQRHGKYSRQILPQSETKGSDLFYALGVTSNPYSINVNSSGYDSGKISLKEKAEIFGNFDRFPSQSPVCGRNDGISGRMDRLRALGNAIVPQVAYNIFRAILETDNEHS